MGNLRIYIGPEPILVPGELLPEAHRPLVREGHAHDRLDRLEAIFPRQMQTDWRSHRLGQRCAISARGYKSEIVHGLGQGHALDIGPGIAAAEKPRSLAWRHL